MNNKIHNCDLENIINFLINVSNSGGYAFGTFVTHILIPFLVQKKEPTTNIPLIDIWFTEKKSWDEFLEEQKSTLQLQKLSPNHYSIRHGDMFECSICVHINTKLPISKTGLYVDLLCFVPQSNNIDEFDLSWFKIGKDGENEWERFTSSQLIDSVLKKESYVCASYHKEMMKLDSMTFDLYLWTRYTKEWKLLVLDEFKVTRDHSKFVSNINFVDSRGFLNGEKLKTKIEIVSDVKSLLSLNQTSRGKKNKIKLVIDMFNYLTKHLWFLDLHPKFKNVCLKKLVEICHDGVYLPSQYFKICNDYLLNHL
jgi:hypothetical protein